MALKIRVNTSESRRETEALKKALTELGSSALENEKDFEKLKRRLDTELGMRVAKRATDDLKKSLNLTRLETAQLQRATGDYVSALKTLTPAVKLSTSSMIAMSAAMAGVGLGINKSLDSFGALDAGLIGIQKTTNATDAELAILKTNILNMAQEIPVATESLLEIAQAAGQLGVQGVENITVFTDTVARLQLTTDLVGEEGAKSLARILNVAGESVQGIDELGSVIVALGNNMAASESEIVRMTSEISRSVSAFKVSSASATAWGAALKAMGAQAELAGSAIGRSMVEIEKSILEGGQRFEYLQKVTGMTGDQLRQTFSVDAAAVFNAWIRGMGRMVDSGESAITLLENFGMTGVEQIKGLTPLIANVDQLDKAFSIANKEMENSTALMEESIKATTSFRSQMTLTWNVVDEIAASIGSGLAPAIVDVTGDFREWVKENQDFIRQDLPRAIRDIADAVSGLSEYFSQLGRNVAVNARAYALLKEGQIGLTTFITSSTNELAELVVQFDKLNTSGSTMSFTEWNKNVQELTDRYERLGTQIQRGTDLGTLTAEGKANLETQRAEVEKQIKAMRDLLDVKQKVTDPVPVKTYTDSWKVLADGIAEVPKALVTGVEESTKEAESALKSFSDAYAQITLSDFDYSVQKLKEQYAEYDKHVKDKAALEEWFSLELKKRIDERDKWMKDARIQNIRDEEAARIEQTKREIDAMNETVAREKKEYENKLDEEMKLEREHWDELEKESARVWEHIVDNISDTFADGIYRMLSNGKLSFTEFFRSIGDMALRQISQLAAYDIMSMIGLADSSKAGVGLFTGGSGGGGILGSLSPSNLLSAGKTLFTGGDFLWQNFGIGGPSASAVSAAAAAQQAAQTTYAAGFGNVGGYGAASSGGGLLGMIGPTAAFSAAGLVLNKIIGKMMEDNPALAFSGLSGQYQEPTWGTIQPMSDWSRMSPAGYAYQIAAQDVSAETEKAAFDYFDTVFTQIEDGLGIAVNDVLEKHKYTVKYTGYSNGETFQGMADRVAEELIPSFLTAMFPDSETITRTVRTLTGQTPTGIEESFVGLSSKEAWEAQEKLTLTDRWEPVYEMISVEVPKIAETLTSEFFRSLAPEGGGLLEGFTVFAETAGKSATFLADFSRQIEDFGETATQAFTNVQTITAGLAVVDEAMAALIPTNDLMSSITAIDQQWENLTETLRQAHATTEQLDRAEKARLLTIGSNITGLTGSAIQSGLLAGTDPQQILNDAIRNVTSANIAEQVVNQYIAPINEHIGRVWQETGGDINAVLRAMESVDLSVVEQEIRSVWNAFGAADTARQDLEDALTREIGILSEQRSILTARMEEARSNYIDTLNIEISAQQGIRDAAIQAADGFRRAAEDISSTRLDLLTEFGGLSAEQAAMVARAEYDKILRRVWAGDSGAAAELSAAARTLLQFDPESFAQVSRELTTAARIAENQAFGQDALVVAADEQLAALQEQLSVIQGSAETLMSIETAAAEYHAAALALDQSGYDTQIGLLKEELVELQKMNEILPTLAQARQAYGGGSGSRYVPENISTSADKYLDANPDVKNYYRENASWLDMSESQYAAFHFQTFGSSEGREWPGFANGGWHTGGLRVVGEKGPELEYTPPARIYSNGTSLDLAGTMTEILSILKIMKSDSDIRWVEKDLALTNIQDKLMIFNEIGITQRTA